MSLLPPKQPPLCSRGWCTLEHVATYSSEGKGSILMYNSQLDGSGSSKVVVVLELPGSNAGSLWHCCRVSKAPFTFIVNIMVPATPPYQLIMSWAADAAMAETANFTRHGRPFITLTPVRPDQSVLLSCFWHLHPHCRGSPAAHGFPSRLILHKHVRGATRAWCQCAHTAQ